MTPGYAVAGATGHAEAVQVLPLRAFYRVEPEQQDFYERNVRQYWQYRTGCGRDERLKLIWGSPK